jgi:hypothetical protein
MAARSRRFGFPTKRCFRYNETLATGEGSAIPERFMAARSGRFGFPTKRCFRYNETFATGDGSARGRALRSGSIALAERRDREWSPCRECVEIDVGVVLAQQPDRNVEASRRQQPE